MKIGLLKFIKDVGLLFILASILENSSNIFAVGVAIFILSSIFLATKEDF